MILYHGTTARRARRICLEGFLPRKPSRRVWFAKGRGYAEGRARTQARRAHDRPVVLSCNIDLQRLRQRLGGRRVFQRGGNVAIDGSVPASVLRERPGGEVPTSAEGLAKWVNRLLGLKAYKGVWPDHPGIERLSRWVHNRLASQPWARIAPSELLQLARQCLPDFFEGTEIDPERLRVRRRMKTVAVKAEVEAATPAPHPREDEAMELLDAAGPEQRVRGLKLLAKIRDPDLFDWCVMFLEDESPAVRVAALRTMLRCEKADPQVIVPLAEGQDKRIRAAAIAALAKHSGRDAPGWFERGLKDPNACVRVETAAALSYLDPDEHRAIFELALYDPNPQVAHLAEKLTAGKGFAKLSW